MKQTLISLLIATIGRTTPLVHLFETLQQQTHSAFEVFIADQNPPGFLDEALRPFETTLAITRVNLSPCGVSAARNTLLPMATGDIIAFPDDDCWYAPHTLEYVVSLFSENPHAGGLLCAWADKTSFKPQEEVIQPVTRISAFRKGGTLVQFYRKEVLANIQFDPQLGPGTGLPYGCGEDTDFLLRVLATGSLILRTNNILVYHPEPNFAAPALLTKAHAYAMGRMHLLRKYNFPLWFKLANVLFPLLRMPLEGKRKWHYRKTMFLGRLKGLLHRQ